MMSIKFNKSIYFFKLVYLLFSYLFFYIFFFVTRLQSDRCPINPRQKMNLWMLNKVKNKEQWNHPMY